MDPPNTAQNNQLAVGRSAIFQAFCKPIERDCGPFQWGLLGHKPNKLVWYVNGRFGMWFAMNQTIFLQFVPIPSQENYTHWSEFLE